MSVEAIERDEPFNDVVDVSLDPGQEAVIGYQPEERISQFFVPIVAISRRVNTEYTIEMDGKPTFGPAGLPPTDIDDVVDTFRPPEKFEDRMEVVVTNLSDSSRLYQVQVIGWERRRTVDEDEGRGW